jgi:hypothetical protein
LEIPVLFQESKKILNEDKSIEKSRMWEDKVTRFFWEEHVKRHRREYREGCYLPGEKRHLCIWKTKSPY